MMKRISTLVLIVFLVLGSGVTSEDNEPYVCYCNDYRFTRHYHPEMKSYINYLLNQLRLDMPDSTNSNVKYTLSYPPESPLLYSSSFCEQSSVSACQSCLRLARKKLLHECDKHAIGGEFYSETCAMRFEMYNFFT
ncbi:hypothetical protein LINPERPRIM_LOCUS19968 [Linum perenne]